MPRTAQILIVCLSLVTADAWAKGADQPGDGLQSLQVAQSGESTQTGHEDSTYAAKQAENRAGLSRPEGLSWMQALGQIVAGTLTGALMAILAMQFVFRRRRKKASLFDAGARGLARRT